MGIQRRDFGNTSDGKKVELFTLINDNGVSASFTNLGAVWVSMLVPDAAGKFADVVLGYDSVHKYEQNIPHFGAPIGRNANRIREASFELNGKKYYLAKNSGNGNNLHSGPDYFKTRIWNVETTEDDIGSKVIFSLVSPDGDQGYPGNLEITISYTLTPDNSIIIEYRGVSDQDTIFNFTNHSYFNLAGHQAETILKQEVMIDSDYFTVADEDSIPTGEIAPVAGTAMDFNQWKPLGQDIDNDYIPLIFAGGYDHNYVLKTSLGEPSLVAKLRDKKSGRLMEVFTDLPGMHLYTGNFLKSDVPGKEEAVYYKRSGVCFETQFFPSAITIPTFIQPILRAGELFETTTVFRFGVENIGDDKNGII